MRFLIIAALAVLSIATHAHAQAPRTYTATDLTEDRGYTTLGELGALPATPVEAERPSPPPARTEPARTMRPTRMAPAPEETWILEPRLHPALCARYGYQTQDGCMIPADRVARERVVPEQAAYATPAQSTEQMIRISRTACQRGFGTPVFVDPTRRAGYQGCIPPPGGLARWESPRSVARAGFAPHRYGYAPQRYGYAPQRSGSAPQRDGYAPQRLSQAPQRDGYAPQRMGSAPQRTEAAPQRTARAPQRVASAPQRIGRAPFR